MTNAYSTSMLLRMFSHVLRGFRRRELKTTSHASARVVRVHCLLAVWKERETEREHAGDHLSTSM